MPHGGRSSETDPGVGHGRSSPWAHRCAAVRIIEVGIGRATSSRPDACARARITPAGLPVIWAFRCT